MRRGLFLAALVCGCTTVRVAQRGGCWVRSVEKWPDRVTEDVGPCPRAAPAWTNDRLTRLVQECVAQDDWRWETRALAAWQAGQPLPARDRKADRDGCLDEATRTAVGENERLQAELKDLTAERDRLRAHDDAITQALGEAAKKPAGSAVATASASGKGDGASSQDATSRETRSTDEASTSPPPLVVQPPASPPVILQSPPPAPAPQPIVLQSQAPMPYPTPQVQPIVLAPQSAPMPPIVITAPAAAPVRTVVRYVRVPAKRAVKKRLCPPATPPARDSARASRGDCVTPADER